MKLRSREKLLLCIGATFLVLLSPCHGRINSARRSSEGNETERLPVADFTVDENYEQPSRGERKLWSFWNLLFLVGPDPCHHPPHIGPHHIKPPHCDDEGEGEDEGSSTYVANSASDNSANSGNGEDPDTTVSSSGMVTSSSIASNWMLWLLVGAAVAAALIAIGYGQRRKEEEDHPLKGSVSRRMSLFSNFADNACGDNACGGQKSMEMVSTEGDYQLS